VRDEVASANSVACIPVLKDKIGQRGAQLKVSRHTTGLWKTSDINLLILYCIPHFSSEAVLNCVSKVHPRQVRVKYSSIELVSLTLRHSKTKERSLNRLGAEADLTFVG
jgi:hypothetical protein